jgi:hypothetical protein
LSLPFYLRLPAVGGFLASLLVLMVRGRIGLGPALRSFWKIPYLMLFKGSFFAMELGTMCIDYDDFARREERRFMTESVSLGHEENLLRVSDQIVPVRSPGGKKYEIFYANGIELRKYGFSVPSERLRHPALLLGGTSIPVSNRKRLIKSFLEAGYEVASIENPIGGPFSFGIDPVRERPEALKDYMEHLRSSCGVTEINVVAQSYSAFELVRVLQEDPLRYSGFVKCMILVNPPGFDENVNMAKHIYRFLWRHVIRGYLTPESSHPDPIGFSKKERVGIATWTYKSLINIVRSLREVHDIVHYRIKAPLKALDARGYKVCFFVQTNDQVVPARITLKHAREVVPESQIKCVEGGHNDLFFQEWQRKAFMDFYEQMTLPR